MRFTQAVTRQPAESMQLGLTTQNQMVDFQLALKQHQNYVATLEKLGVTVHQLPPLVPFPDSHFVEDAAIIYKKNAIMTLPGAQARREEPLHLKESLKNKLPLHEWDPSEEALLDGGDVIIVNEKVLIGISDRTNAKGAENLKKILCIIDPAAKVSLVEFEGVLHLKSGLVALTPYLLLGNPLMKLKSRIEDFDIVWLPKNQGYAANCLVANGHALIFPECDAAEHAVIDAGLKPIPLDLSEFRKMDGSFTCLSLLW